MACCGGQERGCPSYRTIRREVYRLDAVVPRYEALLDRLLACGEQGEMPPRDIFDRLAALDTKVQRLGAELIVKELPPCEMQEQIDCVNQDLRELHTQLRERSMDSKACDK